VPALIVLSGPEAGNRFEVEGEHTIGREEQEFTLSDPEVSRRHAFIRATDTTVEIEDAGSSNGTFVNGDRIEGSTELSDGDTVRMGQTMLSVEAPRSQSTKISAAPPVDPSATVVRPSAEVAAPQPGAEQPAPGGPPEEPAPAEPEPPAYQPQEPVTPIPGEYQAPQPQEPPAASAPQPDFVREAGGPGPTGYAPEQPQYGSTEPQPPYEAPQGQYAPPAQGGWTPPEQQPYGGPGYAPAQKKSNMWLWIAIAIVVVAAIAAVLFFVVL
jgi:pSer/pThr/pTyr-binding forkhead associated (FHA) protein